MKRTLVVALFLFLVAMPVSVMAGKKPGPVDIKNMSKVFIGWVDVDPGDYHKQGYSTQQDYANVISGANTNFQKTCSSKAFSGKTVTGAQARGDEKTAGNDLYVKFSDVRYDHKYRLHIAVHLIDLKTNAEIGSIPLKTHGAHFCTLSTCLDKELDEVSKEVENMVGGK